MVDMKAFGLTNWAGRTDFLHEQAAHWLSPDFQSRNVLTHDELTITICIEVMIVCVCTHIIIRLLAAYCSHWGCDKVLLW